MNEPAHGKVRKVDITGKFEFLELSEQELLFVDPHGQEFVTNNYSKIVDKSNGFKGQHFSQLLLEAFNKGKLKSARR